MFQMILQQVCPNEMQHKTRHLWSISQQYKIMMNVVQWHDEDKTMGQHRSKLLYIYSCSGVPVSGLHKNYNTPINDKKTRTEFDPNHNYSTTGSRVNKNTIYDQRYILTSTSRPSMRLLFIRANNPSKKSIHQQLIFLYKKF